MSSNLVNAFNMVLNIQAKEVTFHQISSDTKVTVKAAPSNYFRNKQLIEEMVSFGREFVISAKQLQQVITGVPERGDKIIDTDLGTFTVIGCREMLIMGNIVGYRVRTD